jgi:hypothetical protein
MLLASAWRSAQLGGDLNALMMQAGLAGLGLFLITAARRVNWPGGWRARNWPRAAASSWRGSRRS